MRHRNRDLGTIRRVFNGMLVLAILLWTGICAGALARHAYDAKHHAEHMAHQAAIENVEKDLLYRHWVAGHGGVYVPVSGKTRPNPYLSSVRERDVVTPSGRQLTLVNPASMTRQVYELAKDFSEIQGHITSLNFLRPENAPDPWEEQALRTIQGGRKVVGEVATLNAAPHYRLMYPLYVEQSCLKCHASMGYKLGDLRGGISVSIPMKHFAELTDERIAAGAGLFGGIWALGIGGVALFAPFARRRIREQEQAEEALHRSLDFTQSIIDNEPECVKITGPDGLVRFMNDAGLAMIDADGLDAVLGKPIAELVAAEHREAFLRLHERVFARESGTLEFEMVGFKGTRRWLETHAVPLLGKDGTVESALGITRDITQRKRAEDALRKSEEQYRLVVESVNEGIWVIDQHAVTTFVNPHMASMLGCSVEEMKGRSLFDFVDERGAEITRRKIERRRQGIKEQYDCEFVRKDGKRIHALLEAVPIFGEGGQYDGSIAGVLNITERKQAEDELRRSEERLRQAQKIGRIGSWEYDIARRALWWSDEVYAIFGMDPAAGITFLSFLRQVHPEDRDRVNTSIQEAVRLALRSWQNEYRIVLDNGEVRHLYENAATDFDDTGEVVRRRGIVQDVSERKRAEEHRKQLEHQVQQSHKIESVGRLAGGIAHDINNMLTPILGYAEMLELKLSDDSDLREDLAEITNAASRVRDMTRQLLAFARKQTLEMARLDLNEIVSGFLRMLEMALRENIVIMVCPSSAVRPVLGDRSQLEQVIMNLAVNAQDAMPTGGTFTLATRELLADDAYVAGRPGMSPGQYVQLLVSDTGVGMDEATAARVFDPFFTTKESGRGTGLGLATVYGIIKQHGGYIEVRSTPGEGSEFIISLPVNETADAADAEPRDDREVQRGSETVLVVEDQEQVLRLTSLMLTKHGYRVLTAQSGEEALRVAGAAGEDIRLVVSDVIMPDMNGKELHERLEQISPGVRILYMSGYPADVIGKHGVLESGVNFLRKPFSARDLTATVRRVIDHQA